MGLGISPMSSFRKKITIIASPKHNLVEPEKNPVSQQQSLRQKKPCKSHCDCLHTVEGFLVNSGEAAARLLAGKDTALLVH